jgi:glycosyltransferase involved in cell wall biosynthesis
MRLPPHRLSIIDDPALDSAAFAGLRGARDARVKPATGRRFIAIGRLVRQKNFAMLLRAFAAGAGEEDRLTILGEGPQRRRLTRLADRLGLTGRLTMPGHDANITRWLGESDILLVSSDYEGVPAVVIEALAAGLVIVATDCSTAMAELLDNGRLGCLVPPGDTRRLARGIAAAPPRRGDMAAAEQQAARFSVATAAPLYLAVMRRLATAGGARLSNPKLFCRGDAGA